MIRKTRWPRDVQIGPETQKLLKEIDGFLARSGMAETTLGQYALTDAKVVGRLRQGGSISIERAAELRRWIGAWKPERVVEFKPRKRRKGKG